MLVVSLVQGRTLNALPPAHRHKLIHQDDACPQLLHGIHNALDLPKVLLHRGDVDVEKYAGPAEGFHSFDGGFKCTMATPHKIMGLLSPVQADGCDHHALGAEPASCVVVNQRGVGGNCVHEAERP